MKTGGRENGRRIWKDWANYSGADSCADIARFVSARVRDVAMALFCADRFLASVAGTDVDMEIGLDSTDGW